MKKTPMQQSQSAFSRVREAIAGRFGVRRADDRLERGADYFVKQHAETMKMLARESDTSRQR